MAKYRLLDTGDPAPWFAGRSAANPRYLIDSVAGRYIVLCFFGSSQTAFGKAALSAVAKEKAFFNDDTACFFGISNDATDEKQQRIQDRTPGYRFFFDTDGEVSRLYGALPVELEKPGERHALIPMWYVLDPTMRILKRFLAKPDGSDVQPLIAYLKSLPPPGRFAGFEIQAPVLILPNVFEPDFCRKLIGIYDQEEREESGFMREVDGKTVRTHDHGHKRRRDYTIEDEKLIKETQALVLRRIVPEIAKVHQFQVTRMERYIVCCYAAEDKAHFGNHRDNTTKGTAHRRFAVSINLNDAFEGGEVSFPEYGPRSYKPPVGGAVVFSCSLLHRVSEVTQGRRYAFLPFLYDEAAARVREENNQYLGPAIEAYKKQA